jgi:hypothetical protein
MERKRVVMIHTEQTTTNQAVKFTAIISAGLSTTLFGWLHFTLAKSSWAFLRSVAVPYKAFLAELPSLSKMTY